MLSLYTNLAIRLRREEKGATAVEYGIMVGLIAVVIIAVVVILGPQLAAMFQGVSDSLPDAPAAPSTSAPASS
jgi:pilus assembly protein Flp/PilA